jgi:enoyl-CoA hydratase
MSERVELAREERLAVVTINHPPVNALNRQVMEELKSVFDRLAGETTVGAVIVTGAGEKAFVAGADISEFPTLNSANGERLSRSGQLIFQKIADFPAPVIAAVNGFALGGGLELALCCDIRVIAENAKVGLPEVTLGIFPGYGGTQRLPRLIAPGKARELIFSGAMIDAATAYRLGLAEYVVGAGEALDKAREIAATILKQGPIAVRLAKQAVNRGLDQTLEEGLKTEAALFAQLCDTADQKEGARAFLEKRPPQFKGE